MARALAVEALSVTYGAGAAAVHALGPVSLSLAPGEICAVIGPSGCGKSTLLRALCGAVKGHEGRMLLGGEAADPRRHAIGFVPQDFGLLPWKTVRQNCLLALKLRRRPADARAPERLEAAAERLGISDLLDRYPSELSGGQRQRAAIARAFLPGPDLLLMDEPFSSLDALTREHAQLLFLETWRRHAATTVFVTHSIEEAAAVGRRIIVLSQRPGTVVDVVDNPCFGAEGPGRAEDCRSLAARIRSAVGGAFRH